MTIPKPNTHPDVAKNQHLVPQTYMKAWSYNGGNSVWVYDKKYLEEGLENADEKTIWKIESRSIERINAITNFYDMKAGDMYLSEDALEEIYGFLKGYDISFEGENLDTYEKLNQHFFDIDNWVPSLNIHKENLVSNLSILLNEMNQILIRGYKTEGEYIFGPTKKVDSKTLLRTMQ